MDKFAFVDALTGDTVEQDQASGDIKVFKGDGSIPECKSIFFPGCSMINYAMPLVSSVYDTLKQHNDVDGISLLCCGKILSYEPNGDTLRSEFEAVLRDKLSTTSITRIVCACPNCVKALREALACDRRTSSIELIDLPSVLVSEGYQVDKGVAAALVKGNADSDVLLSVHDSCPDRDYGQFADGIRKLMPDDIWADPAHCRRKSVCCGSLPRAAGKVEAANKCADLNGREAVELEADAIVTPCMSCTFQLNMAQQYVPCFHVLELLYNWRVNWASVGNWMKIRFLFNDIMGCEVIDEASGRRFEALGGVIPRSNTSVDAKAAAGVDISNNDTLDIGL